ncbi:mannose-1-phosphate guanylyltransferase [Amycolatopsis sp. NPDC003865]
MTGEENTVGLAATVEGQLHVLIPAGGSGTRLWPVSREGTPKFLLDVGTGEPLLLDAVRRALAVTAPDRIHIVTSAGYVEQTREITRPLGVVSVICEPEARDTCAAIALGSHIIALGDPDAVVVSTPADQFVPNDGPWRRAITALINAADDDRLACLGIVPTRPDTGFGYMYVAADDINVGHPCAVTSFHEKPDAVTATSYLKGKRHLWNSGIMAWRAAAFGELVARCAPAVSEAVHQVAARGHADDQALRAWRRAPRAPIEPVLLEPAATSGRLNAVPAALDWRDLGSWTAVADMHAAGGKQDRLVLAHEAHNCSVTKTKGRHARRYVLVGVRDLVVVDCEDVVMIMHRGAAQDVKKVIGELTARGWADLT